MNSKYCKPTSLSFCERLKIKGRWKEEERKLVVDVFLKVSRMSGQVPKLGLKYWKLRARKLTLHLINGAEVNAQQN